jgi:RNA polymerase sigma-70 factor (ECF subfamily)
MNEQQLWDEMIATHIREGQQYAAQGSQAAADHQFHTAFEVLVRNYQRAVVGFCAHMLREWTAQAEDIAQDVFLAIWKTLPQFRHEARIRTWVFTIARYHCVDAWDQRARHASRPEFSERSEEDPHAAVPAVHEQYEHEEFLRWVKQALAQLPPPEREVLVLTYIAELPPAEIASILGVTEAGVRTRRRRALDHLREIVAHERS